MDLNRNGQPLDLPAYLNADAVVDQADLDALDEAFDTALAVMALMRTSFRERLRSVTTWESLSVSRSSPSVNAASSISSGSASIASRWLTQRR